MNPEKRIQEIFNAEKRAQETGDWTPEQLKNWNQELRKLEFELQEQAGYPRDETYHQNYGLNSHCVPAQSGTILSYLVWMPGYIDVKCPVHGIKNKKD